MTTNSIQFVLKPDSALVALDDGSGRLLDLNGSFFALSPSATEVLQAVLRSGNQHAAQEIAARYQLEPPAAAAMVESLTTSLQKSGVIVRHTSEQPGDNGISRKLQGRLIWLANRLAPVLALRIWLLLALAYFSIRIQGWPRTLEIWKGMKNSFLPGSQKLPSAEAMCEKIRRTVASHILPVNCKERSLLCWSLLRAAGIETQLIVGIDFFPFSSHCWCESDGDVVCDFPGRCANYHPIFIYQ